MRGFASSLVLLLAMPGVAAAQDAPVVEIGAGWSLMHDSATDLDFYQGFLLSVTFNPNDAFGIVGELGYHSKDEAESGVTADLSVTTALGGIKLGRNLYVQALAGWARAKLDVSVVGSDIEIASESVFCVQPGLGLDVPIGRSAAVRLGGDYRRLFGEADSNEWRAHAGIAFYIGGR
jgi:hypothetical protein